MVEGNEDVKRIENLIKAGQVEELIEQVCEFGCSLRRRILALFTHRRAEVSDLILSGWILQAEEELEVIDLMRGQYPLSWLFRSLTAAEPLLLRLYRGEALGDGAWPQSGVVRHRS